MKKFASIFVFLVATSSFSQITTASFEKYPVFAECTNTPIDSLENCFNYTLQQFIYKNFKTPEIVFSENYKGKTEVLFEVNKKGAFNVLYVDAIYNELKDEAKRVFKLLPKITPATYNGNPAYVQFSLPIRIPIKEPLKAVPKAEKEQTINPSNELAAIKKQQYTNSNNQTINFKN